MKQQSILNYEMFLPIVSFIIMFIGILFIYSSGISASGDIVSYEYIKQIIWMILGVCIIIVMSLIHYTRIRSFAIIVYVVLLCVLLITLFFGVSINGARSWLGIGVLGIQPAEFMKLATIIVLARYLEFVGPRIIHLQYFIVSGLIVLVPVAIILAQPDLGTAFVYIPIFMCMVFVAGTKKRYVLFLILCLVLSLICIILPLWGGYVAQRFVPIVQLFKEDTIVYIIIRLGVILGISVIGYIIFRHNSVYWIAYALCIVIIGLSVSILATMVLKDYQLMRLVIFLDPNIDARGSGWNIIQSVTAIGSGGLWGRGFLQGTQSHYQFLPEQSTDFIFSILAEEWGFIGSLSILVLFLFIIVYGLFIASKAKEAFGTYVGIGIVSMIAMHLCMNIGMVMGIMPVVGLPLLMLSYGGSSLLMSCIAIGILTSISNYRIVFN